MFFVGRGAQPRDLKKVHCTSATFCKPPEPPFREEGPAGTTFNPTYPVIFGIPPNSSPDKVFFQLLY
jgi:hypothetical protein